MIVLYDSIKEVIKESKESMSPAQIVMEVYNRTLISLELITSTLYRMHFNGFIEITNDRKVKLIC